jgi:hypothetical protein
MPGGFDAYGQPQQGGYPGGPPPKKSKTGLVVGIAIAAVLVIGGVVTLIVVNSGSGKNTASTSNSQTGTPAGGPSPTGAPQASSQGSPPSSSGDSPPSTSSDSSGGTTGSPEDVSALKAIAGKLVSGFGAGDAKAVKALVCDPTQVHDTIAPVVITFQSGPTFAGSQATLTFAGTDQATGKQETFPLNAKKQNDNWCILTD